MLAVGVIEVVAGLVVAFRPKVGGYLVAAWLAGIIGNLLPGARTVTTTLHGPLRTDPRSRQEFFAVTGISR